MLNIILDNLFNNKKTAIFILVFFYFFGSISSLTTGISHDSFHEQLNWIINFNFIKTVFSGNLNFTELKNYQDKYYGIGFQFLSQPLQYFIAPIVEYFFNISKYGAHLLSKNLITFNFFFISGYFIYLIFLEIIKDKKYSFIFTLTYYFYPYFLGHSFINPKDSPFATMWIINTYFFLKIIINLYLDKKISYNYLFTSSLLTAFLFSIRISGLLILIQYAISLIIFFNIKNKFFLVIFIKNNIYKFLFFIINCLIFTVILYPIFWSNPFEVYYAIISMSKHYNNVCTYLMGECVKANELPINYIPLWLLFKLPITIIIGLFIFLFVEKKIFKHKINIIFLGTISLSVLIISLILIFLNVHLYNEIRQVSFLITLLFIISLVSLYYYSKRIALVLNLVTIFFFLVENVKMHPYQYTWFNSLSRTIDIQKNFEVDYWGVSNKNLSYELKKIITNNNYSNICIFDGGYIKEFINNENINCYNGYSKIDAEKIKPFLVVQNARNLYKNPKDCKILFEEKYKLIFYQKDLLTGRLWLCD